MADGGGFEPPGRGRRPLVFKTSSFGRSDNHPDEVIVYSDSHRKHNRLGYCYVSRGHTYDRCYTDATIRVGVAGG